MVVNQGGGDQEEIDDFDVVTNMYYDVASFLSWSNHA